MVGMKEKYVVWLTSEPEYNRSGNAYGYWSGKSYRFQGELYPIADNYPTERTKIYTSRKRAENALETAINNYAYVLDGKIEELK